jgi:hypothetical protein
MLDGKTPASGASSCRLYRSSSEAEAGRWGWNSRGVDRKLKERRKDAVRVAWWEKTANLTEWVL